MISTAEEIEWLKARVTALEMTVLRLSTNPPISIGTTSNFCNCTSSQFTTINGAMICTRCNRPLTNLKM